MGLPAMPCPGRSVTWFSSRKERSSEWESIPANRIIVLTTVLGSATSCS
jgi:hypothetical protein